MRVAVDASQLTQDVALYGVTRVPDGQGGYTETLVALTPPRDWAAIEPATTQSDELPMAGTVVGNLSHHVVLRWRGDVDLHTQLTFTDWGGTSHRLYVRAVQNPLQQSELLNVWCEEQVT